MSHRHEVEACRSLLSQGLFSLCQRQKEGRFSPLVPVGSTSLTATGETRGRAAEDSAAGPDSEGQASRHDTPALVPVREDGEH